MTCDTVVTLSAARSPVVAAATRLGQQKRHQCFPQIAEGSGDRCERSRGVAEL